MSIPQKQTVRCPHWTILSFHSSWGKSTGPRAFLERNVVLDHVALASCNSAALVFRKYQSLSQCLPFLNSTHVTLVNMLL